MKETLKRVIRVSNWEKGLAKRAEKEKARKVTERKLKAIKLVMMLKVLLSIEKLNLSIYQQATIR